MSSAVKFCNVYFPEEISCTYTSEDTFHTEIVSTENATEQRKSFGLRPSKFEFSDVKTLIFKKDDYSYEVLKEHHLAMHGAFIAFRFRDKLNYKCEKHQGFLGKSGKGDGYPTKQLYKRYYYGGFESFKKIVLPNVLTAKFYVNDVLTDGFVVNPYTGLVNLPVLKREEISSVSSDSLTNLTTITTSRIHSFKVNDYVYLNINNASNSFYRKVVQVLEVTDKTVKIDGINTGSMSGNVEMYAQPGTTLRASFEFDFPVRYNSDELKFTVNGELVEVSSFTLIEVFDDLQNYVPPSNI